VQDRRSLEAPNDCGTLPGSRLLQIDADLDVECIRQQLFVAGCGTVDEGNARRNLCNAYGTTRGRDEYFFGPFLLRGNVGNNQGSQQSRCERPRDGHPIKSAY
jgi:hypothetical protein